VEHILTARAVKALSVSSKLRGYGSDEDSYVFEVVEAHTFVRRVNVCFRVEAVAMG
jgi:hypothetical protein